MAVSSLTANYDALLSTTLYNYSSELMDQISTGNVVFWWLKNKREAGMRGVDNIGQKIQIPLMYELGKADFYSGYDILDTSSADGITAAFYDWRQMSVPIAISRKEERQNAGKAQIIDLLEAKINQAELGIQDLWGRALLQGNLPNGGSPVVDFVSAANGASGFDPLGFLIQKDPTSAATVGNIAQNTYSWWQNKVKDMSSVATNAAFGQSLRNLYNQCSRGPGGFPDLHVVDQQTYETYESYLATFHRNPDYTKADIPFDNLKFKGGTVVWDEFVPDVGTPGAMQNDKGTWFMINTKFLEVRYDKQTNFINTPFVRPANQDAKVSEILWMGATCINNRRKHGVAFTIKNNTALT